MTSMKNRLIAVLTAAALFLAACGGSGSDSEPAPTPDPDDGTGGITGTGVAVGPITGFGSVIVNGVRYETDGQTTYTLPTINSGAQQQLEYGAWCTFCHNMSSHAGVDETTTCQSGHQHGNSAF